MPASIRSAEALEDCRSNGILAPLAGVIGRAMAVETIKLLTGIGRPLVGRLWQLDATTTETSISQLKRHPPVRFVVCSMMEIPPLSLSDRKSQVECHALDSYVYQHIPLTKLLQGTWFRLDAKGLTLTRRWPPTQPSGRHSVAVSRALPCSWLWGSWLALKHGRGTVIVVRDTHMEFLRPVNVKCKPYARCQPPAHGIDSPIRWLDGTRHGWHCISKSSVKMVVCARGPVSLWPITRCGPWLKTRAQLATNADKRATACCTDASIAYPLNIFSGDRKMNLNIVM